MVNFVMYNFPQLKKTTKNKVIRLIDAKWTKTRFHKIRISFEAKQKWYIELV